METLLALVVGILFGAGFYMMMQRNIVKLIIGLALLSHAANLLIFVSAGLVRGAPPLIGAGAETLGEAVADPLPQALILTAIVISFGVLSFAVVLILRAVQRVGTADLDDYRSTDT